MVMEVLGGAQFASVHDVRQNGSANEVQGFLSCFSVLLLEAAELKSVVPDTAMKKKPTPYGECSSASSAFLE